MQLLSAKGIDTAFCITGGAAAHLLESLRTSGIKTYHNYNEQACAMAAEGYARVANKPALVVVTNGPGSSNTITGVLGAWQDSLPMFILSGQVPRHQTMSAEPRPLRQLGLQEADVISMVKHCTNYAVQLTDKHTIKQQVDQAWQLATSGRMGPVWLEVPIDLQAEIIEIDQQSECVIEAAIKSPDPAMLDTIAQALAVAKKPLIIAGNGIHLASAQRAFKTFIDEYQIPVVCTYATKDLFNHNDPLYVGNLGLLGERAANFAVQQADLLLVLGSRLSIPVTGYNSKDFAPHAKKIMVDIDADEVFKHTLKIDYPLISDLNLFFDGIKISKKNHTAKWNWTLQDWKTRFDLNNEPHIRDEGYVNSFDFVKELSNALRSKDTIVTDMGTSFTCTMQAIRNKGQERLFTSYALCAMGFGLPGAIGAHLADSSRRTICITGDGGIQMNIQELQTIAQYKLPIKTIVLNNDGYLAITLMQDNLFAGRHFGSDSASGVGSPDFCRLAEAYGIPGFRLHTLDDVKTNLADLLSTPGPALIEINMVRNQLLIPRVQSKKDSDGKIISGNIDAMFPFLDDSTVEQVKAESRACD